MYWILDEQHVTPFLRIGIINQIIGEGQEELLSECCKICSGCIYAPLHESILQLCHCSHCTKSTPELSWNAYNPSIECKDDGQGKENYKMQMGRSTFLSRQYSGMTVASICQNRYHHEWLVAYIQGLNDLIVSSSSKEARVVGFTYLLIHLLPGSRHINHWFRTNGTAISANLVWRWSQTTLQYPSHVITVCRRIAYLSRFTISL